MKGECNPVKRLIVGVATLIALAVLLVAVDITRNRRRAKEFHAHHSPLLPDVAWDRVDEIDLELPDALVTLKNKNGQWVLPEHDDYPANPIYVRALLDTLKNTPRGSEVSRDVSKLARFQLDAQARVVILRDAEGTELGRLMVGKPDPSYRSTYVRLLDDPTVRFVTADLVPMLSRVTWADRTVWRVPIGSITRIESAEVGHRGARTWQRTHPDHPITDASNRPLADEDLNQLAHITAANVLFDRPTAQPQWLFELDLYVEGVAMTLHLGRLADGSVVARREKPSPLFQIPPDLLATIQRLTQDAEP